MGSLREEDRAGMSGHPCLFRHEQDIYITPGEIHTPPLMDLMTPLGPLNHASRFIGGERYALFHAGEYPATTRKIDDPAYWYTTPVPGDRGLFVSLRRQEGAAVYGEHSYYFFYDDASYGNRWLEPTIMIELPRASSFRQADVVVYLDSMITQMTNGAVNYVMKQSYDNGADTNIAVELIQRVLIPHGNVLHTSFSLGNEALTIPAVEIYYGQALQIQGHARPRNLSTDVLAVKVWPYFRDSILLEAIKPLASQGVVLRS